MGKGLATLGITVLVIIAFFILTSGGYYLLKQISPFSNEINFGTTFVVVLGFFVGAGFTFKKLRFF